MTVNESVLEMHYHKPLMDLFRETLGVGTQGSVNFYKYSPRREVFIGFDQAYAKSELSEYEFFQLLKQSAQGSAYKLHDRFIGYFLQFKVVLVMKNRMKHTPAPITARPHYRSALSTTKDIATGHSQHELLFRLAQNPGAMVYYACPMLFEREALYEINVELETLRLPDVRSCPSEYGDNDHHSIYFNDKEAEPIWCSDPVIGKAATPRTLAHRLLEASNSEPSLLAASLLDQLTNIERFGLSGQEPMFREFQSAPSALKLIGEALTIVRVTMGH